VEFDAASNSYIHYLADQRSATVQITRDDAQIYNYQRFRTHLFTRRVVEHQVSCFGCLGCSSGLDPSIEMIPADSYNFSHTKSMRSPAIRGF